MYVASKLHAAEYGVHSRLAALVPAEEMNDSVSQMAHASHRRLVVAVGCWVVKAPFGQWLRVVVQLGENLASKILPLAMKVPAGHLFQYWDFSVKRLPPFKRLPPVQGVSWHLQLPSTATQVSLVTTAWHTRSVVADGAAVSQSPASHTVNRAHERSEYALFGTVSYSVELHIV
jgi:hypothetical protein